MKIMRIQVDEDLDWESACLRVASMVDPGKLKRLVEQESENRLKLELILRLNRTKSSLVTGAKDEVRQNEDNFRIPRPRCGKFMFFHNSDNNWKTAIESALFKVFAGWTHTTCH